MKKNKYILIKRKETEETIFIDYESIDGYTMKPRNNIKYDGIKVNKLVLVKPSLVTKIIKKKTRRKLELYLQFLVSIIDSDTEDDTIIKQALDDMERYKALIKGIYFKYLDDKYYHFLLQKIESYEHELYKKMQIISSKAIFKEEKKGKSR